MCAISLTSSVWCALNVVEWREHWALSTEHSIDYATCVSAKRQKRTILTFDRIRYFSERKTVSRLIIKEIDSFYFLLFDSQLLALSVGLFFSFSCTFRLVLRVFFFLIHSIAKYHCNHHLCFCSFCIIVTIINLH